MILFSVKLFAQNIEFLETPKLEAIDAIESPYFTS
jgi:hypothetical protein